MWVGFRAIWERQRGRTSATRSSRSATTAPSGGQAAATRSGAPALVGSIAGVTVFLALLTVAVQILVDLYQHVGRHRRGLRRRPAACVGGRDQPLDRRRAGGGRRGARDRCSAASATTPSFDVGRRRPGVVGCTWWSRPDGFLLPVVDGPLGLDEIDRTVTVRLEGAAGVSAAASERGAGRRASRRCRSGCWSSSSASLLVANAWAVDRRQARGQRRGPGGGAHLRRGAIGGRRTPRGRGRREPRRIAGTAATRAPRRSTSRRPAGFGRCAPGDVAGRLRGAGACRCRGSAASATASTVSSTPQRAHRPVPRRHRRARRRARREHVSERGSVLMLMPAGGARSSSSSARSRSTSPSSSSANARPSSLAAAAANDAATAALDEDALPRATASSRLDEARARPGRRVDSLASTSSELDDLDRRGRRSRRRRRAGGPRHRPGHASTTSSLRRSRALPDGSRSRPAPPPSPDA